MFAVFKIVCVDLTVDGWFRLSRIRLFAIIGVYFRWIIMVMGQNKEQLT